MDKAHEANAPPPYYEDQVPPYTGNESANNFPGSIQQSSPSHYGSTPTQTAGYHQQPPPVPHAQIPPDQYDPPHTQATGQSLQDDQQTPPVQYAQVLPAVQPVVIAQAGRLRYGKNPLTMTCMHCRAQIQTSIKKEQGALVWICGGVIFLIGLACCLCCLGAIPFFIDHLKRVEHTCPNCKCYLGVYNDCM